MKFREKKTVIKFPVFSNYHVVVSLSNDAERARKSIDSLVGPFDGTFDAVHSYDEKGHSWLFLREDISAGTLAHECWHVVRQMFEWSGAKLDNECVAYHLGYLVDTIWDWKAKTRQKN